MAILLHSHNIKALCSYFSWELNASASEPFILLRTDDMKHFVGQILNFESENSQTQDLMYSI